MSNKLTLIATTLLLLALLGYLYRDSLVFLAGQWLESEDYSHGLFVPFISIFLAWQSRFRIAGKIAGNAWWGIPVVVSGLLLYWVGELTTLYVMLHISLWLVIVGVVISLIGIPATREMGFPLFYLLMAIPLPVFLYAKLSGELQLLSSTLGVGCLQLIGVTAFREGNVIDLGPVQLQVVEACSGIRYLLPLTSLALLCAYLFKDKMWKRVVLVLSSIPISVLVNGFRIGVIGVLVETYGQSAAEGFYHLFEGWVLFMISLAFLILEMWLLARVGAAGRSGSLFDHFSWSPVAGSRLQVNTPISASNLQLQTASRLQPSTSNSIRLSPAYLCSVVLLIPMAVGSSFVADRDEKVPDRAMFVDFPMQLGSWQGTSLTLEKQYIDTLRFDDYVLAEYSARDGNPVSFYSAYYRSQKKGQSAHSPQSCLPGGGWEISSLKTVRLPIGDGRGRVLEVNRALIQKDSQKQVALYWFKQRDRILANEFTVKFYLLWDALTRGRTDGALVRIASLIGPGETEGIVDQRLQRFVSAIEPELNRYVPD